MKKLTTEEFIKKAKKIHGNKYDYSKVEYVKSSEKVCIVCPEHGEFWQRPNDHLSGYGCFKCRNSKITGRPQTSKEEFIERSNQMHNSKYDYSKVEYVNSNTKVCIICPIHGDFFQLPRKHMEGCGCYKCGKSSKRKTLERFISDSISTHGKLYDYDKTNYINNKTKVILTCHLHGDFLVTPDNHLNKLEGCPICKSSKLELKIRKLLEEKEIEFIQHADKNVFSWLERQHLDFYLPKQKIAIECQGKQHFELGSFGSKNDLKTINRFNRIIELDKNKKNLCEKNGIKLLYYSDKKYNDTVIIDENKLLKEIILND